MAHTVLSTLVNNTLRVSPNDPESLVAVERAMQYLQPSEVQPQGLGGWNGDKDFLLTLLARDPKRLGTLIGPRTIHPDLVDTLLDVDHRPSAQIADRVASHKTVSRKAIDYVLANGTHKALSRLLRGHFEHLTVADLRAAHDRALEKNNRLIPVPAEFTGEYPTTHYSPQTLWRDLLEMQIDALIARKGQTTNDRTELEYIAVAAVFAGIKVPTDAGIPLPDEEDMWAGRYAARRGEWNLEAARSTMLLNPDLKALLAHLPLESQVELLRELPRWTVVENSPDPARLLEKYRGAIWNDGTCGPSDELLGLLPLSRFKWSVEEGAQALRIMSDRLGEDTDKWASLSGLVDSWTGSLNELLDTVDVL